MVIVNLVYPREPTCTPPAEKSSNDDDDSASKDVNKDGMSFRQLQHICIRSSIISCINVHYFQTLIKFSVFSCTFLVSFDLYSTWSNWTQSSSKQSFFQFYTSH